MRALDLFSGLGGWGSAFRERGHEVVTSDLDLRFGCDITGDILADATVDAIIAAGPYDIILASPPCEGFTVMNIGRNWFHDGTPKTDTARLGLRIVEMTRWLINGLDPAAFIIENPRAKLRKLPVMDGLERRTVTYCQYGLTSMKPTDLWGGFPPTLELHPPCKNGDPCHVSAPRGSRTPGSIQGMKDSAERAKVPYDLSLAVCIAMEEMLAGSTERPGELF